MRIWRSAIWLLPLLCACSPAAVRDRASKVQVWAEEGYATAQADRALDRSVREAEGDVYMRAQLPQETQAGDQQKREQEQKALETENKAKPRYIYVVPAQ